MGFFAGFSGEFGKQLATSRAEEANRAERQSAMESQILQHLSTSPDPEIASHAITGLLDLASPQRKAKGLAGWLGKVAEHPALPTIRQLISQGRQVEDQPPQAPRMNVEEGLRSMPGTPVGDQPAPAATRPMVGPPGPDDTSVPSAATPPPSAPFASGFQPATTETVPRQVFLQPGELEAQQAGQKETAVLAARGAAYDKFAGTPGKQSIVPGVNNPPAPHPAGEIQDEQGNWFRQDVTIGADGTRTITRTPISKVAPRPTAGQDSTLQGAKDLQAAALAKGIAMSDDEAIAAFRVQRDAMRIAKVGQAAEEHDLRAARLKQIAASTTRLLQQNAGTTPLTEVQIRDEAFKAISAANVMLGNGPDVTPADVEATAKEIQAKLGKPGGGGPPRGPQVSPTRAALSVPLSGVTPPPAPASASVIPEHLQDTSRRPRAYSMQGKQTLQAIGTTEPLLTKLVAAIKAAGLEQDNSIIGEQFNKVLYNVGISPGDPETDRLFTEGVSRAYGMRGLVGGRSNQILQNLYGQHLVDPGDSPQLVLRKAQDLLAILPDIRKAVDDSEAAQVGAHAAPKQPASGTAPAGAPPAPGGRAGTAAAVPGAAPQLPPEVASRLKAQGAGRYTLKNGQIWVVDAAGNVRPGG